MAKLRLKLKAQYSSSTL